MVVAVLVMCFRYYKPQIVDFFTERGIDVPGITDDTIIYPSSETIVDESGNTLVAVNVPSIYAQNISQEQIDLMMSNSDGKVDATRGADGSLSINITPEYRDEILAQMGQYYDESVLNLLVEGKVLSVNHNSDYSAFSAICNPDMSEREILTLTFKLFAIGRMYGAFAGIENESIRVDIVDSQTEFITNSYISDDMGPGLADDARNWAVDMFDQTVSRVTELAGGDYED